MDIEITKYYNSKGQETSKEHFLKEHAEFLKYREEKYQAKKKNILAEILDSTDEVKVKMLYQYLVNRWSYDYEILERIDENGYAGPISHPFWNKWGLASHEKYAPLLIGSGSCSGIAAAIQELCQDLGINCEIIKGETVKIANSDNYLKHSWNLVEIENEKKHLDITYGILNRDSGLNRNAFCLLTNEELKNVGPHHNFDDTIVYDNISRK